MARPQQPVALAVVTGQAVDQPARFAARMEQKRKKSEPLGDPPEGLNLLEIALWCEVAATLWWLTADHRMPAEMLCRLMARVREGEMSSEVINGVARYCKMLGADSSSGAKIIAGEDEAEAEAMY